MKKDPETIAREEALTRLKNARAEVKNHFDLIGPCNEKTYLALAVGVLDHAIEYVRDGRILSRRGLYSALMTF